MLVKSSQLHRNDTFDNLIFIEQQSSLFEIPVVENKRLGCNIVYYRDIDRFIESSTIEDTLQSIKESNHIEDVKLALLESEFLEGYFDHTFDPILSDIVIYKNPISEDVVNILENIDVLIESRVMGTALKHGDSVDNPDELVHLADVINKDMIDIIQGMFKAKSEDEFNMYKDALKNEYTGDKLNVVNQKQYNQHFAGFNAIQKIGLDMVEQNAEEKAKRLDAEKFPKSAIAKAIQKLRSLYQGIMYKCSDKYWDSKIDPRVPVSMKTRLLAVVKTGLKSVAHFVMNLIDILLRKLQNASDSIADAGSRFVSNLKSRIQNSVPSIQPAPALA